MKIKTYLDNIEIELEVYKVQTSLFGKTPSVLIYNEDKTQMYETANPKEVKTIRKFIGLKSVKEYCCGYQNEDGQIVLQKLIPRSISKEYRW